MESHSKRMIRERRTIDVMVTLYCKKNHHFTENLCTECKSVMEYAHKRLDGCPFNGDNKPTCLKCPVHCYHPEMRTNVRKIMRYSGPRLLIYHPYLAIMHLIDAKRSKTNTKKEKVRNY